MWGRHRPRRYAAFYDHTLEALFPQDASPGVRPVKPAGEMNQQPLHELAQMTLLGLPLLG